MWILQLTILIVIHTTLFHDCFCDENGSSGQESASKSESTSESLDIDSLETNLKEDNQTISSSLSEEDTTKFLPLIPLKISSFQISPRGSRRGIVGGGGIDDSPLELIETEEHPLSSLNVVPSNLHAKFGGLRTIERLLENPSNFAHISTQARSSNDQSQMISPFEHTGATVIQQNNFDSKIQHRRIRNDLARYMHWQRRNQRVKEALEFVPQHNHPTNPFHKPFGYRQLPLSTKKDPKDGFSLQNLKKGKLLLVKLQ